jgi:type II secretory pathway pseudopilin PulG
MKKLKRGTTLIELVIYMGLLSILLLILTQTFTTIIQTRLDTESTSSVQQDGNYLISRFMYDISRAQAISTPSTFGTGSSLVINIGGTNYTYTLSNGKLQLTNSNGTNDLNSYDTTVSNLQFTRIGNGITPQTSDTIKVNFTLTSIVTRSSGKETQNFEITVAPR